MKKQFIIEFAKTIPIVIFIASALSMKAEVILAGNNEETALSSISMDSSCKRTSEYGYSNDNSKRAIKVKLFDLHYEIDLNSKEATVVGFEKYLGINHVYIEPRFEYNGETFTVVAIGEKAFQDVSTIQSVKIPDTVTIIKQRAFYGCDNLADIDFGNGVRVIEEGAFSWNYNLESVTIPDSVTTIGYYAFWQCSNLKYAKYGKSVCNLPTSVFSDCKELESILVDEENPYYTSIDGIVYTKDGITVIECPEGKRGVIELPETVTRIGDYAFSGCYYLTEVILPESLNEIGYKSFVACRGLKRVAFGDKLPTIGENAFAGCVELEDVRFGRDLHTIGRAAFYGCESLQSISFTPDIEVIGESAFEECTGLKSVEFTSKCQLTLEMLCFYNCPIRSIYCDCLTPPVFGSGGIIFNFDVYDRATLYVPEKDFYLYYITFPWSLFAHRDILENVGVETVFDNQTPGSVTVYRLDGTAVLTTGDTKSLNALPSGIYIINGKKVMIK